MTSELPPCQPTTTYKYLDPVALSRLKNLSLAARQVVEGYFAGMHQSPHKGFSIEFAEHREYTPGIDPRHIDWRVLGRRDKLYVKQYEEETSLRCYLLLDKSGSMGYKSDECRMTKLEYASLPRRQPRLPDGVPARRGRPDHLRHRRPRPDPAAAGAGPPARAHGEAGADASPAARRR